MRVHNRKRNVRDPEHKQLLTSLKSHFEKDERLETNPRRTAKKKRPIKGCYAVGPARIRRRKVNRATAFYIHVRRGRGWMAFDTNGNFSVMGQPRGFLTPGEAWKYAKKLRRQYPKELGKRVLYVTDRRPTRL